MIALSQAHRAGLFRRGEIPRTATSVRNGATSSLAGVVHCVFMRRMAESVSVQEEVFGGPEDRDDRGEAAVETPLPSSVLVYRIDGPFFFGAAEKLESTVERAQLHVETVVIRLGRVPFMDATGTHTLSESIERFRRRHIRVLLCEIHPRLYTALERAEILALVGPDNICAGMTEVSRRITRV